MGESIRLNSRHPSLITHHEADIAIRVTNLSKCYQIYDRPEDRLKQALVPRLQRLIGRTPTQYAREFWALKDVSFEVKKGETVGIIGRNGSGKSTLLQLICGTLAPTYGTVETSGRVAALLELGAGFNPEFTGRENVYMNGAVLGLTKAEIDARFDQIAAFADIGQFIEQPVKTYSSGMHVRLAFAVIAHVDADILIIDEALAVGDAFFNQKCMRFLRRFSAQRTLLFVSHDGAAVQRLCSRAVLLDQGVAIMQGLPREVINRYCEELHREMADQSMLKLEVASQTPVSNGLEPSESTNSTISKVTETAQRPQDNDRSSFGVGGARIVEVRLHDEMGHPLLVVSGGEKVQCLIRVEAERELENAIIGCYVKNRLGQLLFGDTTQGWGVHGGGLNVPAGHRVDVKFEFRMPFLLQGEYFITAAVAEGTVANHVHLHFCHEAMMFRCVSPDTRFGLVGIPMDRVTYSIS